MRAGRRLAPFLALVALLAIPVPARDVLVPGYRPVVHELVIEASPHFDEHDFVAEPVLGFAGNTRIVAGEPFRFSSKYATRVYAVPKGAVFSGDRGAAAAASVAAGDVPVQETGSVPLASPVQRVRTTLRIASVADGHIELQVVDEHEDWDPVVLTVVGLTLALGVAGMVVLARRLRARNGAAP